jgi:hypothetical protein
MEEGVKGGGGMGRGETGKKGMKEESFYTFYEEE